LQGLLHLVWQGGAEGVWGEGLIERLGRGRALVSEVRGQSIIGIAVALRADNPHLLTTHARTERVERMPRLMNAVDPRWTTPIRLPHRLLPCFRHHPVERDVRGRGLKARVTPGILP
jgi:hypothetical protein